MFRAGGGKFVIDMRNITVTLGKYVMLFNTYLDKQYLFCYFFRLINIDVIL